MIMDEQETRILHGALRRTAIVEFRVHSWRLDLNQNESESYFHLTLKSDKCWLIIYFIIVLLISVSKFAFHACHLDHYDARHHRRCLVSPVDPPSFFRQQLEV